MPDAEDHDGACLRPADVARLFRGTFRRRPDVSADAPGRVNLIGEHTDYNAGFVLPVAIPQRCAVALARRDDAVVQVASTAIANATAVAYRLGSESRTGEWADYVRGCTVALAHAGHRIRGFDLLIASRVPVGAGLASSAALEVSTLRALRQAFDLALDDVALAKVAHVAEERFVGARVGIMDPMAASLATTEHALFIDARSLAWERVALPREVDLVVIDSRVAHRHAYGAYNVRRAECERAAAVLGVSDLRDLSVDDLADRLPALPAELGRRVHHVVTENTRVLEAVTALRACDVGRLGALVRASHLSLRDDYEVSTPEIDLLVDTACRDVRVFGARLTGGGFGGSIVALAQGGSGANVGRRIARNHERRTGRSVGLLVPCSA